MKKESIICAKNMKEYIVYESSYFSKYSGAYLVFNDDDFTCYIAIIEIVEEMNELSNRDCYEYYTWDIIEEKYMEKIDEYNAIYEMEQAEMDYFNPF